MSFEFFALSVAAVLGLAAKRVGLPPLIGFLAAGFAVNATAPSFNISTQSSEILDYLADIGVLLLLFTVGLKLKVRQITEPQVIGGALIHFTLSVLFFAPICRFLFTEDWEVAFIVATALAFSSTVLAAKMLEAKKEMALFHGRTAIGILIVQDIIALVALAVFSGKVPGIWALLAFGAPLLRPVLFRLMDMAGHDELLVLLGMAISLVIGGVGFEIIGLKGEIGALVMGMILAGHSQASELSRALWGLKEVFLVGFFLSIGMSGLPDWNALWFSVLLGLLLPIKGVLFFALLVAFKLRARTAFLSALSLTAYSEFGLIVAANLPQAEAFLVPMAIAVSVSFLAAAPLNRIAHPLVNLIEDRLIKYERKSLHPDEIPAELGDSNVLVFGMGRTGLAAYEALEQDGMKPIGLDADVYLIKTHMNAGRNVSFADAEDSYFWAAVDLDHIKAAVLAMDDLEAKLIAARKLREKGFEGPIVSHALYEDHVEAIKKAGADETYLTMRQAGRSLADHALTGIVSTMGR